jgi:dihydroorotase
LDDGGTTTARAAARGGFTGIVAMPNTDPPIDSGGLVRYVRTLAREQSPVPVWTSGCITKGRAGQQLADIADMQQQGAVMITDDGEVYALPDFDIAMAGLSEPDKLAGLRLAKPLTRD